MITMFQEMEPYLPVTSKCARFCLSTATVIFWVSEYLCVHARVLLTAIRSEPCFLS